MLQNAYFVDGQRNSLITIGVIRDRGSNPRGDASVSNHTIR